MAQAVGPSLFEASLLSLSLSLLVQLFSGASSVTAGGQLFLVPYLILRFVSITGGQLFLVLFLILRFVTITGGQLFLVHYPILRFVSTCLCVWGDFWGWRPDWESFLSWFFVSALGLLLDSALCDCWGVFGTCSVGRGGQVFVIFYLILHFVTVCRDGRTRY